MRYVRKPDRYMSLASALLKHLFIHRTAKIPWDQVVVQRTPKPHSRPYWEPPYGWTGDGFNGLEFNVSHQAGMVVLVGCRTPNVPRDVRMDDHEMEVDDSAVMNPDPTMDNEESESNEDDVRIGVDVACTWEPPRTPDLSTQLKLEEWVEIFAEMFSDTEREDMKHASLPRGQSVSDSILQSRRFYTYWALKEAYIKMVGEGLLASWLTQLQLSNVPIPQRPRDANGKNQWTALTPAEISQMKVMFGNKEISHTVLTTLEGFEEDFIIATMTRGVVDVPDQYSRWKDLDIFADVGPCATKRCHCLD